MERQELIRPPPAGAAAAPGSAEAKTQTRPAASSSGGAPEAAPGYRSPRRNRSRQHHKRRRPQPLFYAHCASAQQTLLHMTIAKGEDNSSVKMRVVRVAVAEFVATALLVGVGCSACTTGLSHDAVKLSFFPNLGFGLTVGLLVMVFGHLSGCHINPSVTVCALILEMIEPKMAFIYIPAQFLGATAGYGLLRMVTPLSIINEDSHQENGFCTTVPSSDLSTTEAFCSEYLATSLLILLVCAAWDTRNPNCQNVPTQFALGITGIGTIFGHRTGASMNPARSFGPAVWNGVWTSHWLYWVAPVMAAVVTTIFYRSVFGYGTTPKSKDQAGGEEMQEMNHHGSSEA